MLNKYPLWKNLVILLALVIGGIYALPNLYPDDYAIQISGARSSTEIDQSVLQQAEQALKEAELDYHGAQVAENGRTAILRVESAEKQLEAKAAVQSALGDDYIVALNLASTTPDWLRAIGAESMKLGLDLRGGVHFLLEVDTEQALKQRLEVYASDIKRRLREDRIRYRGGEVSGEKQLTLNFQKEEERDSAFDLIKSQYNEFLLSRSQDGDRLLLTLTLSDQKIREIIDYAVEQNLTTLRNRVNELGVAEPLVQRQGRDRIVVELPGVQDTAQAKRVLGATANLEFRLEARADASASETETFQFRDNPQRTARLEEDIIVTGENVANAQQSFDQSGMPQVNITLDAAGGRMMNRVTRNAIKRRMAVLYIEHSSTTKEKMVDGEMVKVRERSVDRKIISLATIQSVLGSNFRITGLNSVNEAAELALLLRAGSLAAPIYFAEERTIGPSLGQQNIDAGVTSVYIGFALVVLSMLIVYKGFGVIANVALVVNLVLIVALMSMLSATLTLPGIAGIVLTVGMAVDANVLIFERIKEEWRGGMPPQSAIHAGYSRAFVSILDANITTFLVAIILFAMGTGPVKGFAVTLCIGILTSVFTAVMFSRAIVNGVVGGRQLEKLSI
ncbi:protein translocase subunit SecD [Marinobacteraceae bacterium S3BR75-40.1]